MYFTVEKKVWFWILACLNLCPLWLCRKDLIYHVYIKNELLKLNYLLVAKREEWEKNIWDKKKSFIFLLKILLWIKINGESLSDELKCLKITFFPSILSIHNFRYKLNNILCNYYYEILCFNGQIFPGISTFNKKYGATQAGHLSFPLKYQN